MTNLETSADIPTSGRGSWGGCVLETALIVVVFFVLGGEPPPHVNEPHYLCRVTHYWNPDYGQGDLFLESRDAHVLFNWSLGAVADWPPTTVAWIGRLGVWLALAVAWRSLSWRLVPVRLFAVLSAMLWVALLQLAHLAGEWVVGGFETKCVAYVFVLFALRAMVDRWWNRTWLLLGVASAFHALVGGWSTLIVGGIWLCDDRSRESFLKMLPGLVGGGLIALIGVVPALALNWGVAPDVAAEAARIYVFERLPHHLALLRLSTDEIIHRFLRHAVLIGGMVGLARWARRTAATDDRMEIDGLRRIEQFAWGAIALAVVGLAIEIVFWNHPLAAARLLRYYWFRLTDFAVPMAAGLYVAALVAAGFRLRRDWAVRLLLAALLVAGWQMSVKTSARVLDPRPPADRFNRDRAAWVEACRWIGENTPEGALFLTPRRSHSFKWHSGRAEVATWKDIPQDAESMVEWYDRTRSIFYEEVDGRWQAIRSLGHLGTARVQELADRYDIDYVLTDHRQPLAFPIAYANDVFVVYDTSEE